MGDGLAQTLADTVEGHDLDAAIIDERFAGAMAACLHEPIEARS